MNLANMKRSETTEQIRLMNWARMNEAFIPELSLLYHIPNEGKRTNGGIIKAAGMRKGVPDLCLPVGRHGFHGLYIEMKFEGGKTTKEQNAFIKALQEQGNKVIIAYSAEQAREVIRNYLSRAVGFDLVNCEEAPKTRDCCEGVPVDWAPCSKCEFFKENKERGS